MIIEFLFLDEKFCESYQVFALINVEFIDGQNN